MGTSENESILRSSDRLIVPDEVVSREIGDETVLLDLAQGTYFGLATIGSEIWSKLEEDGITLEEACDLVLEKYDVDRETAENDIRALFADLLSNGLAVVKTG